MAQAVEINLLGKTYRVACPEGEEQKLRQAADELSQRMQELKQGSKVNNPEHLAIMVGLQLGYDLQKEQEKHQRYSNTMDQRINELQLSIEQALLEQSQTAD